MALIHIIFKEYISGFHGEQPESKCWNFAIYVDIFFAICVCHESEWD